MPDGRSNGLPIYLATITRWPKRLLRGERRNQSKGRRVVLGASVCGGAKLGGSIKGNRRLILGCLDATAYGKKACASSCDPSITFHGSRRCDTGDTLKRNCRNRGATVPANMAQSTSRAVLAAASALFLG